MYGRTPLELQFWIYLAVNAYELLLRVFSVQKNLKHLATLYHSRRQTDHSSILLPQPKLPTSVVLSTSFQPTLSTLLIALIPPHSRTFPPPLAALYPAERILSSPKIPLRKNHRHESRGAQNAAEQPSNQGSRVHIARARTEKRRLVSRFPFPAFVEGVIDGGPRKKEAELVRVQRDILGAQAPHRERLLAAFIIFGQIGGALMLTVG